MTSHGLTTAQLKTIKQILSPFASHIERVGLFGSRATGQFRPYSDIDLVLYGPIDEAEVDRILTLFNESNLPMKVDVIAYHFMTYAPLKEHVDEVVVSIISHEDLLSAAVKEN